MESQPCSLQVHAFSAFKRTIQPLSAIKQGLAELQAFVQQAINLKKKITLLKAPNYLNTTHPFTHILIDFLYSLQMELANENQSSTLMTSRVMTNQISMSLFKNICLMIQQSLFIIDCKYSCQISLSMFFEKGLVETFRLCFIPTGQNQHTTLLNFLYIDQIFNTLLESDYRKIFLGNVYTLHSGSIISIEKINFAQNLKCIITNIGKVFTEKTNLITRNLKNVKKSKFINEIVTNSIKTICNYKNQEFINEEINRIVESIFGTQSSLAKEQFMRIMEGIMNRPVNSNKQTIQMSSIIYTVFLYIDLFRVEAVMIQDSELKTNILKQKQVNSSNFYTQQMQKLLKKCPYNGDQCCDCKKCQCVRRNRQSAKLSQQKKRNAVEQLDPMKKRIEELERRNKQLEQQNKILRGIVSQLKNQKGFSSNFSSTIESVSKVLQN